MSRFEWKWKSLEMSQEDKCTETLEGDKIGCIYSVMIKMATTTNVQETTEDRRRQKYRKNNPKLVQLSNFKFSAKVSRKRQVDTDLRLKKIFKPTVKYLFMTRTTSNKSKNSCPRKLDNCLVRRKFMSLSLKLMEGSWRKIFLMKIRTSRFSSS